MVDDFILRALAAGIGVALIAGPLGCFVVWRRMAYFGDSLAHSALLGIALGLLYGININLGTVIICTLFAFLLVWLQQRRVLATDTLLGILAHAALSIGMVALSFLNNVSFDLYSYLFGDILTVRISDLYWIYGGGLVVIGLLVFNWSSLTLMTLNEDLARAEGVNTVWANILLMLLMTIVVAVSIRIVGILLITSMLIIPAATARQLVSSPENMAIWAAIFGLIAVIAGISGSVEFDTPSGPSIVTAAAVIFALLSTVAAMRRRA
ncbi:iron chelate uptake ABC transporter family permease subunit [Sneathiella sp.]|uniref:iron chelate uptake ABC transporter family permease subunit n=1 Tax=Sneathiella sp. TaxID=1964365 RepID=UPI002627FB8E|nr:iron chelate uptake ABC transporter family permease subunit [Sneathiella sp.]MDF2368243.1 iron chelate uptake ABC transporter family permease subunit [Sneathiella sp.]